MTSAKPEYRVPLMTEIGALPWNGLNVVSTFSGCGGSCLGFKMAGYRVLWANEFVPAARETYAANHAGTILDGSDIRLVTPEIIRAAIGDVEIDVLEGSPPCASFSTAGKTSRGWGEVRKYSDVEQRTDDLFEQYIRLLDGLRPRAFVAENVSGMVKGVAKGFFKRYLKAMRALPYNVEARLLDAQWLGVPQQRVRIIFVGVRKDVGEPRPALPLGHVVDGRWQPYRYSVRDALPWIGGARMQNLYGAFTPGGKGNSTRDKKTVEVDTGGPAPTIRASLSDQLRIETEPRVVYHEGFPQRPPKDVTDTPSPTIKVGVDALCSTHFLVEGAGPPDADTKVNRQTETRRILSTESVADNVAPTLDGYAIGAEYDKLGVGESSDRFFNLVRPDSDLPCPTVTQTGGNVGAASVAHPFERRKFSIGELRRICGFPDDFILTGSYSQQWERLGRSVPPPMMRAVAAALVPVLKKT